MICPGDSTTIGTPARPGKTYLWAPGGETTAEVTVSPASTATYTVTETTAAGSASDSVTVFVIEVSDVGLSEDFATGAASWTPSGLWHLADSSLCGDPAPTTPPTAAYYGQDDVCDYNTGAATAGSLTSPEILGVDATSELTFHNWRQVESFAGPFDITKVDIVNVGDGSKTNVFYLDSSTPSGSTWSSSGPISLAAFAGQAIQVEFTFNSADSMSNDFIGWLIDDVEVTSSFSCAPACPDNLSFENQTVSGGVHKAGLDIAAGPNLAIDGSLQPVRFIAGNRIALENGVEILGDFTAETSATPCD